MAIRCFVTTFSLLLILSFAFSQDCGCTDPLATNYNPAATLNDGSCLYPATTVTASQISDLPDVISGTSSLLYWNDGYWTCNDHSKLMMYKLDTLNGNIIDSLLVSETIPYDMEEISQDAEHLYFGDFGNNANTRTDLHILRVGKAALLSGTFSIDTIFFTYPDQTDFTASSQTTDFDCESFIVGTDSIYLFTKQWTSLGTSCYAIPKIPGTYIARKCGNLNIEGLVTGATFFESQKLVVLCGYSNLFKPFLYLLYDFPGNQFFSGNKRKINSSLQISQMEGVACSDLLHYYVTNEHFQYNIFNFPSAIRQMDLTEELSNYLDNQASLSHFPLDNVLRVYPNPAADKIFVRSERKEISTVDIYDTKGICLMRQHFSPDKEQGIALPQLKAGFYILRVHFIDGSVTETRLIKN